MRVKATTTQFSAVPLKAKVKQGPLEEVTRLTGRRIGGHGLQGGNFLGHNRGTLTLRMKSEGSIEDIQHAVSCCTYSCLEVHVASGLHVGHADKRHFEMLHRINIVRLG